MEINAACGLLACLVALRFAGPYMVANLAAMVRAAFELAPAADLGARDVSSGLMALVVASAKVMAPILGAATVAAVASNVAQVGFNFTLQPLAPDWNRINPVQGFARIFSVRAAVELGKSLLKVAIVGWVTYSFLRKHYDLVAGLTAMGHAEIFATVGYLAWQLFLRAAVALVLIAGADYVFQRFQFERSIRMTKQEVKDEWRRSEGDPLIRSRLRQRHRELARARMMQEVARATVVVTNPVHVAVALRYQPQEMDAPEVVAKGQRLVAQRIKEVARENGVPVVENPELARALFHQVEVGQRIPADLYQAVAEIIAFVYRLAGRTRV
jgi:flagellar biosynthetic protein FlhB